MTDALRRRAARAGNGPRRVAATAVALSLLLASGCSSRASATETEAGARAGAAGAPTALPSAGRPFAVCQDAAGDGGAADLLSVTAITAEQQVFLAFAFAADVPPGPVTVTLQSASPERQVQIALRDAQPVTVVMRTADRTASAANPDEVVHVAGADVHVVLPDVMMPPQARGWNAVTTAGAARDVCGA
jgi:hypothetical protein